MLHTGEGSGFDYTLGITMVRALFEQSSADEVVVTFRVDSIALEPDEEFALELVPSPLITLPSGDGVFFINRINMTIIDSDSMYIRIYCVHACMVCIVISIWSEQYLYYVAYIAG